MSQPEDQQQTQFNQSPSNQSQQPQGDLANELRELGQQIEQAVRTAIESDRAKQIQRDIASGLKEIGGQVQTALRAMQENPRVQQFVERGEQAVNQAQQSKTAQDFQEALARGVAQLNDQLATFVTKLRQDNDSATSADAAGSVGTSSTTSTDFAGSVGTSSTTSTDFAGSVGTSSTTSIPIETPDEPATGPTRRLDSDL